MDKQRPWHVLNLDISDALRNDLDLIKMRNTSQTPESPVGIWFFDKDRLGEILTTEWIKRMRSIGIPIWSALVFYRDPYFVHPEVHVDLRWTGDLQPASSAINWVFDPLDDSEMTWYDLPYDTGTLKITPANTRYLSWPMEEAEPHLIASRTIGVTPTLVNTAIAHNIIVKERPRWVVSVRCKDDVTNWEQALEFYKPWIVE